MRWWIVQQAGMMMAARGLRNNLDTTRRWLGRELMGKWLPTAMKGAAMGLSGASKALDRGADRLRKNAKRRHVPFVRAIAFPW